MPHQAAAVRLARRERDQRGGCPRPGGAVRDRGSARKRCLGGGPARRGLRPVRAAPDEIVALKREEAAPCPRARSATTRCSRSTRPGMTSAVIEPLFGGLEPNSRASGRDLAVASPDPALPASRFGGGPDGVQPADSARLGYNMEGGRLDLSADPFSTALALRDVRITTRITTTIRSCGDGHDPRGGSWDVRTGDGPWLRDLPVTSAPSLGLHESQSRLWENVIGRSRESGSTTRR